MFPRNNFKFDKDYAIIKTHSQSKEGDSLLKDIISDKSLCKAFAVSKI